MDITRMKRGLLYAELAQYYDRVYALKDYKRESEELRQLILENQRSQGQDLLEVGCGTGSYLQHFENDFSCTGVDISPAMLRIAKKRLKKTGLLQGDMRTFDLGREFDIVLCLFSSIANLKNYRELRQTMKNFSRHLKTGGVLILGPWKHPKQFPPGVPRLFTYDSPDLKLARIDFPKRRGAKSILDFHWLIAEKNKQVRYIAEDRHELTEFSERQYMESMRAANLSPRFVQAKPPATIGLYVAVKQQPNRKIHHRQRTAVEMRTREGPA
jgi:ubiquinone/menaquinone biosynthesis C-methylase UbiE